MPRIDDPFAGGVVLSKPGEFPPGTIAMLAGDPPRSLAFWFSFLDLFVRLPPGKVNLKVYVGSDVAQLRNDAAREAEGDWLWFIDDDHAFDPGILWQLIGRGVDIVQPLCLRRVKPFLPVATSLDGNPLRIADYGPAELAEVMFAGTSGMLIRKKVLDAIEEPWFVLENGQSEDVGFCKKATAAGFKIHVDMSAPLGHTTTAILWPEWDIDQDHWMTGVTVADGAKVWIHIADPDTYASEVEAIE
jgi:Glycosyl transferase family 2